MAVATLTFEVERFEWTAAGRLEVEGRWFGLRGRRFLRPTLDVEVDGAAHRMLAVLEHKPWAADDGDDWTAAFVWHGDPVELAGAELTVAPNLAVELPPPAGPVRRAAKKSRRSRRVAATEPGDGDGAAPEVREARPPRLETLENAVAAGRAEVEQLKDELLRVSAGHAAEAERLRERLAAEQQAVRELREELEEAQKRAGAAESTAARQIERLREERDAAEAARDAAAGETAQIARARDAAEQAREAAVAETARIARERDAAEAARKAALAETARVTQERDAAEAARIAAEQDKAAAARQPAAAEVAKVRAERDAAVRARAAAEQERDAAVRARDRAREERNVWLSRARAATAELGAAEAQKELARAAQPTAPPPEPEPPRPVAQRPQLDTVLLKEGPAERRSAMATWGPRLLALLSLAVFVAVVVALIGWSP
jgi:hypothetical protein